MGKRGGGGEDRLPREESNVGRGRIRQDGGIESHGNYCEGCSLLRCCIRHRERWRGRLTRRNKMLSFVAIFGEKIYSPCIHSGTYGGGGRAGGVF